MEKYYIFLPCQDTPSHTDAEDGATGPVICYTLERKERQPYRIEQDPVHINSASCLKKLH